MYAPWSVVSRIAIRNWDRAELFFEEDAFSWTDSLYNRTVFLRARPVVSPVLFLASVHGEHPVALSVII